MNRLPTPPRRNLAFDIDAAPVPFLDFINIDRLHIRLWDVMVGRGVLIRPRFKQILPEDRTATRMAFRRCITGAARIRVFPWPDVSSTVYFAEFEHAGLVPVAYAVYE